jgi:hypothetical protein
LSFSLSFHAAFARINGCEAPIEVIFGLLAIVCWLFLACAMFAVAIVVVKRKRLAIAVLSAFLLGGILVGALVWNTTRPAGLSFRQSLRAGLTDEGLREYGHPIEHWAESAIILSTYACVLGGGVCAAATLAGARIRTRRKLV